MTLTCPNDPSHKVFVTTVVVRREELVDQNGNFLKIEEEYFDDTPADIFCKDCGELVVPQHEPKE